MADDAAATDVQEFLGEGAFRRRELLAPQKKWQHFFQPAYFQFGFGMLLGRLSGSHFEPLPNLDFLSTLRAAAILQRCLFLSLHGKQEIACGCLQRT